MMTSLPDEGAATRDVLDTQYPECCYVEFEDLLMRIFRIAACSFIELHLSEMLRTNFDVNIVVTVRQENESQVMKCNLDTR
jgi:hypothetical protein